MDQAEVALDMATNFVNRVCQTTMTQWFENIFVLDFLSILGLYYKGIYLSMLDIIT